MAKVELQPGEQILKQGAVPYLKSRFNLVQGGGYLTDRRFVHTNDMRSLATGGLVGTLLKGKVDIEIALRSITGISRGKHGRNESVLEIATAQGQEYPAAPGLRRMAPRVRPCPGPPPRHESGGAGARPMDRRTGLTTVGGLEARRRARLTAGLR